MFSNPNRAQLKNPYSYSSYASPVNLPKNRFLNPVPMHKILKSVLLWSALLASAAAVLGLIVYTSWALVVLVVGGVLLLGAQDYQLLNRARPIKVSAGK